MEFVEIALQALRLQNLYEHLNHLIMRRYSDPGPGNGNGKKNIINKDDDITNTEEQQEIDEGLREEASQKHEDRKPEIEQPQYKPAESGRRIPDLNTGPKSEEK